MMIYLHQLYQQYLDPYLFFYLFPTVLLLEKFFPLNSKKSTKDEVIHNLGWVFINDHLLPEVSVMLTSLFRVSFIPALWIFSDQQRFLFEQKVEFEFSNPFLLAIVVFFSRDLIAWLVHRFLHGNRFMWKIHMLHHSSSQMNGLAGSRGHWLENLIFDFAMAIPVIIFKVPLMGLSLIVLWEILITFFIHSNIRLKKKGIFKIVTSPLYHHWHHALFFQYKDGQNFGIYTNLFDRLFGTYYCPDENPEAYGIKEKLYPKGFIARFFYPILPTKFFVGNIHRL